MHSRRGASEERGQILVIVAGGLVGFLLIVGLAIDGGMAFLSRRDTQNQADLASLAGTKTVLDHYVAGGRSVAEVKTAVTDSLRENGCDTTGPDCQLQAAWFVANDGSVIGNVDAYGVVPSGAQGVKVDVARQTPTFLIGGAVAIFNGGDFSSWSIGASATALTGSFTTYFPGGPLMPIALREPTGGFNAGQFYTLVSGHTAPGNFSWVDFDSIGNLGPGTVGSNDLTAWVCQEEDSPPFTLPQLMDGKPGLNLSGPSDDCLETYIRTGTTLYFPVYPTTGVVDDHGSFATYPITSVVAFVVTEIDKNGTSGLTISGFFRETFSTGYVPSGGGLGAPDPDATSYFLGLID